MMSVLMVTLFIASAQPSLWDLEWAQTTPLQVQILSEERDEEHHLTVRQLSYFSHDWEEGPIRIAAHLVIPDEAKQNPLPGWIHDTGSLNDVKKAAVDYRVVAMAIDRVGEGDSTGPEDVYPNWLDIEQDVQRGWMYHYVMSLIRGVTYLRSLPEVRKDAIGVTGISRGGLCALLANAVDPRIRLAVPIAATGDMKRTAGFENNWIVSIFLKEGGKSPDSLAFQRFSESYDPLNRVERSHGAVFLINGAQDEFFPITSTRRVFERIGSEKRLEVIADCDHGYYALDLDLLDAYNNTAEIFKRIDACTKKAIRVWLHGEGTLPQSPQLRLLESEDPGKLRFDVTWDASEPIRRAVLFYSTDASYTYQHQEIPGSGRIEIPLPQTAREQWVAFVEVEYEEGYYLTSVPLYAEGLQPKIRPVLQLE